MTSEDKNLQHVTDTFSLKHLINEPTCFKGSPSCIDLIITNRKSYFKNTCVTVTGISDFHKLTAFSLKSQILKAPSKIKTYRKYKTFDENRFNKELKSKLDSIEKLDYPLFESIFVDILNTHAPITTKKVRNSKHWENYKKQRNFCTNLLKKTKSEYISNLNIKDLKDNKKF